MFGNGKAVEVVKAPTLGSGPMMMLRAMGIDPDQIFQTFAAMEGMLTSAVAQMLERSRVLSENVEATRGEVAEVNARLDRMEANLVRLLESIGPLVVAVQQFQHTPTVKEPARKPNGKAH